MARLDDLLSAHSKSGPAKDAGTDKLRDAVFAELDVPPRRSWRADVMLITGICWMAFIAAASVLFLLGQLSAEHLFSRLVPLGLLAGVVAICSFAALAPRRPGQLIIGYVIAAIGLVGIVLLRGEGHPSTTPAWVCTVSHMALGAGPLVVMLAMLRKSALGAARTALAGLAVGATGAMLGELSCEQGFAHVAVWHLGAWAGLAVVAMLVARRLVPRSFAP